MFELGQIKSFVITKLALLKYALIVGLMLSLWSTVGALLLNSNPKLIHLVPIINTYNFGVVLIIFGGIYLRIRKVKSPNQDVDDLPKDRKIVGLTITIISAIISSFFIWIDYLLSPNFFQQKADNIRESWARSGATELQVATRMSEFWRTASIQNTILYHLIAISVMGLIFVFLISRFMKKPSESGAETVRERMPVKIFRIAISLVLALIAGYFQFRSVTNQYQRFKQNGKIIKPTSQYEHHEFNVDYAILSFTTDDGKVITWSEKCPGGKKYYDGKYPNLELIYNVQNPYEHENLADFKSTFIWAIVSTGFTGFLVLIFSYSLSSPSIVRRYRDSSLNQ